MCRWGCQEVDTTHMCKWCGTRFCKLCFRGDYIGLMKEEGWCRICNQKRCQGKRVEYVPRDPSAVDTKKGKAASAKGAKGKKGAKKGGKSAKKKSGGKKKGGGKKKKKR